MPGARKRQETTASGGVNKRGSGLNSTNHAGNANYGNRQVINRRNSTNGINNGVRAGGIGGLGLIILLLFNLFTGGNSSTPSYNTNSSNNYTNSIGYQEVSTTYEDINTDEVNLEVASGTRKKLTTIKGNNKDKVTIMVYMCASDLETNSGMATRDLNEMAYATKSDNVNIVVETGGTRAWRNSVMDASTNQRWLVEEKGIKALDKNVGSKNMTDPNTLTDFIEFAAREYPANRYMLIFWDHGAGSIQGYGYDTKYPNSTMTVDEINLALNNANVKFDFIGFDACLMANVETAIAIAPYADYLIASEETEPSTGWYYTNWLTTLSKNSSTPTIELAKQIIDDYTSTSLQTNQNSKLTLSLVDLGEFIYTVPNKLKDFSIEISNSLDSDDFKDVANARSVAKEFGQSSKLDQIDLVHFCKNIDSKEADELASTIENSVKYNRTANIKNAYGLSIYFPYSANSKVQTASSIYSQIGMEEEYTDLIKHFSTYQTGASEVNTYTSNSIFDMLSTGSSNYNGQSVSSNSIFDILTNMQNQSQGTYSFSNDLLTLFANNLGRSHFDNSQLELTDTGFGYELIMDDNNWSKINSIGLNVWVKDEDGGFIDLGIDNVYTLTDEGNLKMDYDGKWLSLNDHVVAYYLRTSEDYGNGRYLYEGYVPCFINNERANIIIQFNEDNPYGIVLGAQKVYENEEVSKGYMEIEDGSIIDYICDYYDSDGNFIDQFYLGDAYYLKGELKVSEYQIIDEELYYGYQLKDIYGVEHYTPMLKY